MEYEICFVYENAQGIRKVRVRTRDRGRCTQIYKIHCERVYADVICLKEAKNTKFQYEMVKVDSRHHRRRRGIIITIINIINIVIIIVINDVQKF